jgi:hypothetical protein
MMAILIVLECAFELQGLHEQVQHIAGAAAVQGGNRYRIAHAEFIEFVRPGTPLFVVAAIDHEQDWWLPGLALQALLFPQPLCHFHVRRRYPAFDIHDEQDGICISHGQFGLGTNLFDKVCGVQRQGFASADVRRIDPAGIDDVESDAAPFRFGDETIARGAGPVVHDGQAFACEAIEQGGLTDVRASDDCNDRFGHRHS